jgi:hypothetical protein
VYTAPQQESRQNWVQHPSVNDISFSSDDDSIGDPTTYTVRYSVGGLLSQNVVEERLTVATLDTTARRKNGNKAIRHPIVGQWSLPYHQIPVAPTAVVVVAHHPAVAVGRKSPNNMQQNDP